jgi:hypothetical protein
MIFSHKDINQRIPPRNNLGIVYFPPLFWWSLLILTLAGVATLSWTFSTYVFDHPNKKIPYKILTKLNKISAIEKFSPQDPPKAKTSFATARSLMENEFSNFTGVYLTYLNDLFLRDYIENYKRTDGVYYLKGTFTVTRSRLLTELDLFTRGTVLSASCDDFPKASVTLILPSTSKSLDLPAPEGTKISLQNNDFSCLLHVKKPTEDSIHFTLLPITYNNFKISKTRSIRIDPPPMLNIEGVWPPIIKATTN